jgi:hypothetical protein
MKQLTNIDLLDWLCYQEYSCNFLASVRRYIVSDRMQVLIMNDIERHGF